MPERKLPETFEELRTFTFNLYGADEMRANLRAAGVAYPGELIDVLAGRPVTALDLGDNVQLFCDKYYGGNRQADIIEAIVPPEEQEMVSEVYDRMWLIIDKYKGQH
ncbi:MAG: hypothetical protein NVSMB39_3470 [Candidatus Saccharimonadales bacterium]